MLRISIMAVGLSVAAASGANAQAARAFIDVLKQAECGCCGAWVARMQEAGFTVNVRNVSNKELYAAKAAAGLAEELWACHTATVAGYTVEGHVPASNVTRLLTERPAARGIATPGMPTGAPGMEYGDQRDAFKVMLINLDGTTDTYATYPGN